MESDAVCRAREGPKCPAGDGSYLDLLRLRTSCGFPPATPRSHDPETVRSRTSAQLIVSAASRAPRIRCDRWSSLIDWWRWLRPRAAAPGSKELITGHRSIIADRWCDQMKGPAPPPPPAASVHTESASISTASAHTTPRARARSCAHTQAPNWEWCDLQMDDMIISYWFRRSNWIKH